MDAFRRYRPVPPWQTWSYSKLRSLHECPLKFWFDHVLHWRRPQAPILAVGSALHYMAFRFFRLRYKSPETFCGAWAHFWLDVVNGVHGPSGFNDRPVTIHWRFEKEPFYWLQRGKEVLTKFFERHAGDRGTGMARLAERRFRIGNWRGLTLTGVIDRIDEYPDHVEVVDYKMGLYPAYMLSVRGSYQPTIYQIAYDETIAQTLEQKPLTSVRIENLFTGGSQAFDIRQAEHVDDLHAALIEASGYVRSLVDAHMPVPALTHPVRRFPVNGDGQYVLWPRLPRDAGHCNTCAFIDECHRWEDGHHAENLLPLAARLWREHQRAEVRRRNPRQEILPLFPDGLETESLNRGDDH